MADTLQKELVTMKGDVQKALISTFLNLDKRMVKAEEVGSTVTCILV